MIKFVQVWRRKPVTASSQFASTLERVRDMREHSIWPPLTVPSSARERTNRVAEAKTHVKVPPLADQRETSRSARDYLRSAMFWRPILYSVAISLALLAVLSKVRTTPDARKSQIVFPDVAYTTLTDSVAERFARRALVIDGLEASEWRRLERDAYGSMEIITFHHADDRSRIVNVIVNLEPGERIVCTIDPQ